jgi:hypothetical protein
MTTKPGYVPRRAVVQMNFAFSPAIAAYGQATASTVERAGVLCPALSRVKRLEPEKQARTPRPAQRAKRPGLPGFSRPYGNDQ